MRTLTPYKSVYRVTYPSSQFSKLQLYPAIQDSHVLFLYYTIHSPKYLMLILFGYAMPKSYDTNVSNHHQVVVCLSNYNQYITIYFCSSFPLTVSLKKFKSFLPSAFCCFVFIFFNFLIPLYI